MLVLDTVPQRYPCLVSTQLGVTSMVLEPSCWNQLPQENHLIGQGQGRMRWTTPQLHYIDALVNMVKPTLKGLYPVKLLSRFADVVEGARIVAASKEFWGY
ncbi:hypothetical protein Ccrd_023329 [Cynara cardunculus var. scolymus]|uniref:Uncharacterized protein n=1 Tax=Cynara cardunculus var. scolymus TaxID=59895 RepID=A0A103XX04_CYNCS|nr:hypothetical protein Ccrd_023329 [Cynara cardunculus var. scolymus]